MNPSLGARSGEDIVRGSTNIPLSDAGRMQARMRAAQFKRRGGVDTIISSSLHRAIETAQSVKDANPQASFKDVTAQLHPWHLGGLEGKPTMSILPQMNALITQYPDRMPPAPAQDSQSTDREGETFNQFRRRVFDYLGPLFQRYLAFPNQKILVVVHYRDKKLLQAWQKKGFPEDYSVDPMEVTRKDGEPGDVSLLYATDIKKQPSGNWGKWHLGGVKMDTPLPLRTGIYFMRHGFTAWNGENPGAEVKPRYSMATLAGPDA